MTQKVSPQDTASIGNIGDRLKTIRKAYHEIFDEIRTLVSDDPQGNEALVKIVAIESRLVLGWLGDGLGFTLEETLATPTKYWYNQVDLRTMPYADYLQTDHWKKMRTGALERSGNRCQICNSPSTLSVHHRTYERRGNENPEDLIVLCQSCHQLFHDNGKLERE